MNSNDGRIRLAIPTIDLLECRKFKGGYYELWGGVLDASYCIADGPADNYPDADDGWLPEYNSGDPEEYMECPDFQDFDNDDERPDEEARGNETGNGDGQNYSVTSAVEYLRENTNSTGRCARAVRQALEAGGLVTDGRPNAAADYDDFLPALGFSQVDTVDYVPQIGDIVVHEAQDGHPYGHIAMFDGNNWISDFIQRDMFGGNAYRDNPDYTIWRY